jgi:hypothetical protein
MLTLRSKPGKKIYHNKVLIFTCLILTINIIASAQTQTGYLIRLYTSNLASLKTEAYGTTFTGFVEENDIQFARTDAVVLTPYVRHFDPGEQFAYLFNNKLQLITFAAKKTFFETPTCEVKKPIHLNTALPVGPAYYLRVSDSLFYIVVINKVRINFCEVTKFADSDLFYKRKLELKTTPLNFPMTVSDYKKINSCIGRIKISSDNRRFQ